MFEFLSNNWVWILLIGGMVFMHLGHGRAHGGHMGSGSDQHAGGELQPTDEDPAGGRPADAPKRRRHGCH